MLGILLVSTLKDSYFHYRYFQLNPNNNNYWIKSIIIVIIIININNKE